MRGAGLKIGRILGIPIYLHSSWFLIFALITYQFGQDFASLNSGGVKRSIGPLAC